MLSCVVARRNLGPRAVKISQSRESVARHLSSKTSTLVKCCSSNAIRGGLALNTRSIRSRNFRSVRSSSQKALVSPAVFMKFCSASSSTSQRCAFVGLPITGGVSIKMRVIGNMIRVGCSHR